MYTALTVSVAAAAASAGMLLLPAGVSAADDSAAVVIGQLEAEGFNVSVDRIGSAPLADCVVTNVRNTGSQQQFVDIDDDDIHNGMNVFVPVIVRRSVVVSLDCTG
ncbi:hypothetical protein [Mycobacterium sp. ACS4331]|uniref:hypothetical protein n=1 Tax=Mycobacterium sp. ACS4331 TaxID=1834121 RepID=UPI0007FE0067|nr:hypothetical protein [Mycobacterium sp. ACS4331]OBF19996.1 hypothetical protein A5727_09595 [Mycobacterium sp. ACS4331]